MAEETGTTKRRIGKKAETVREKAEKAVGDSKQPRKLHATKKRVGAPFRAVARGGRKLNTYKPFRILGFIIVPPYFRNSWKELRQVTWPKFRDSVRLTFAVFAFAAVFGILVFGLDFVLDKVFREVLLK